MTKETTPAGPGRRGRISGGEKPGHQPLPASVTEEIVGVVPRLEIPLLPLPMLMAELTHAGPSPC